MNQATSLSALHATITRYILASNMLLACCLTYIFASQLTPLLQKERQNALKPPQVRVVVIFFD